MTSLVVLLEGDGAFPELQGQRIHTVGGTVKMTCLAGGMESGKPSVALSIPLDDGSYAFVETSLALLVTAARAFVARYGDPTE